MSYSRVDDPYGPIQGGPTMVISTDPAKPDGGGK